MTLLNLSLAVMPDPINLPLPAVIVFLSWAAGKYWLGPNDAAKRIKGIKHDGRRFAYRGAMVAAVCALMWWATSWPLLSAVLTLLASGLAMGIGVRMGFNAAAGLDWRYLGVTSADDRWFVRWFAGYTRDSDDHAHWYNNLEHWYRDDVHLAGHFRTAVEALAALTLVAAQLWI